MRVNERKGERERESWANFNYFYNHVPRNKWKNNSIQIKYKQMNLYYYYYFIENFRVVMVTRVDNYILNYDEKLETL